MVADIGASGGYGASGSSCRIGYLASAGWRCRRCRCWGWTPAGTAVIDRPIPDARREDGRGEGHVGRGSEEKGEVRVGIVLIRSIAVGIKVPKCGIGYQSDPVKGARVRGNEFDKVT